MIHIDLNPPDRVLRQFAGAWLAVFTALAANQWLLRHNLRMAIALAIVGVAVGATGLLLPRAVRWIFAACTIAAFPIGWVVSQAMLLVLFVAVITPVALLFRLRGRDRLSRKRRPEQETYWKPKTATEDVRRYLRQY